MWGVLVAASTAFYHHRSHVFSPQANASSEQLCGTRAVFLGE